MYKRNLKNLYLTDLFVKKNFHNNDYFLGGWCLSSLKLEKNLKNKKKIISYHWDNRKKLEKDYHYLQDLNEELLRDLIPIFNRIHNLNENYKYWKIILGYWISIFTTVLYDRWSVINTAIRAEKNWNIITLKVDKEKLALNTSKEFIEISSQSSIWNEILFSLLIENYTNLKKQEKKYINKNEFFKNKGNEYLLFKNFKNFIKYAFLKIPKILKLKTYYFFIETKLSKFSEIKLQMMLGQFPVINFTNKINNKYPYQANLRKWSLDKNKNGSLFNIILRDLIPILMPRVYLEGFSQILKDNRFEYWPEFPKVIFTSNSQYLDDFFKIWTASKIKNGSKLYIGEHGGFGCALFNGSNYYDLSISDFYFSSGWKQHNSKNIVPIGNLRIFKKKIRPKLNGNVLICLFNIPKFAYEIRSMPISHQIFKYYDYQHNFYKRLNFNVKKYTRIRVYPHDFGWQQRENWLDFDSNVSFDDFNLPLFKSLRTSRLFISTYAATTYLDTLSLNFPTVIFWDKNTWEIKDVSKIFFKLLKDVGIFHDSFESAAEHVNKIFSNVDKWWQSKNVQKARIKFCQEYSLNNKKILELIKKNFKNNV